MASILSAGTTSSTAMVHTADTSGVLQLATNNGTAALTLDTAQNATFAGYANLPNTFGFKNRIINGAMVIDQRNAGASVSPNTSVDVFPCDRFAVQASQNSKCTAQQVTTAPTGFKNSLKITSSSAFSVGVNDYFDIYQKIEGYNFADMAFGTASAATFTLSFWVQCSLTGTFGGSVYNNAFNRSYPFSYTISSANTWEYKTVTIVGDQSGTWTTDNTCGLGVGFGLGVGTNYSGTSGAWTGSGKFAPTGATSVVGTNGATFYITGVQLEKGSTATSFDYRPYGTELALCQRYCNVFGNGGYAYQNFSTGMAPSTTLVESVFFVPATMRTQPTITTSGTLRLTDEVSSYTPSAIVVSTGNSGTQAITLNITTTGLTQFRNYYFSANGDGTAKITLSSEL